MKRPAVFTLLVFLATLTSFSCNQMTSYAPPGSYSEIVVVTDTGQPGDLNDHIIRVLQHPLDYYSKMEIQFRLKMVSADDFEREPPTKNMVIFGVVRQGKIGQIIENFIGTNNVRKVLSGKNNIMKKLDYPVKGQLTVIVTASSASYLKKVAEENGQLIRDIIEEANRERLRENLLLREDEETSADLKAKYGFTLRVPDQYRLNRDWGDLPGVEILRDYPHRGITISWRPWEGKSVSKADSAALFDFRSEVMWEIHDKEVMRKELVFWNQDTFGPYGAVRMDGYWESSEDMYGGPFICFFVHDRVKGRIWLIDCLVYAPGFSKHKLLREAVAVAESFRIQ
jgi:hypothetical protein